MKNIRQFILESKKLISDKMFIKALKAYGELTHDDLVKIFNDYDDNPHFIVNDKVIDSMYVGRGVGLCFSYKENGREFEFCDQSIEDFENEDIKKLYDYIK